ncbi:hypothetical protein ACXX9E_29365 [Pseudomonas sp. GNP014]
MLQCSASVCRRCACNEASTRRLSHQTGLQDLAEVLDGFSGGATSPTPARLAV